MLEDRSVVPRQIYASTVTRRDRRWTSRRRGRGHVGFAVVSLATLLAALTVIAALAPTLT